MRNILLLFLLFCFVTTLVRLQLFSCIVTMFPLLFFSKNAKNKAVRKQTTITCNQGLPGRKSKLNMITSAVPNKRAVVRSFGSSSIVGW